MKPICFVASGRDYHAIDWYRTVKKLCHGRRVLIATELIESEGVERLINGQDEVIKLFNLDPWLLNRQSKFANIWRNLVKSLTIPLVAYRLNKLSKNFDAIFHAHSMYYIFICWVARIEFIGTPMGSDVLVRPDKSMIYRIFTIFSLRGATVLTVDSIALKEKILMLCGRESLIIQNGIDSEGTQKYRESRKNRTKIVSIRGIDSNYRVLELVQARNLSNHPIDFDFIYPYHEKNYLNSIRKLMRNQDIDHGRVSKEVMYEIFENSFAIFSIPVSDSSPRSVYEAIFCGACAVVSYGKWVELLPVCMRSRIIIVDINQLNWFGNALQEAREICNSPFIPSMDALELFDETRALKNACQKLYSVTFNA
jgi:hypothetical protein